jgi:hypothetical protein
MDLTTPLRHPIDTGLKAMSWSVGMVRGGLAVAASLVMGDRNDDVPPEAVNYTARPTQQAPHTQAPADLPTAVDLAQRVSPEDEVITPVGTTGAGTAHNPDTTDTDLQQPGTEPLMDPALTREVAAEAETGARGADPDKG